MASLSGSSALRKARSAAAVLAAGLSLLLGACAPTSQPLLLEGPANAELDRKWEKYGAYYLVDELFVETSFESAVVDVPVNNYIINKKIKILTPEGARFGTVEAPIYGQAPRVFKLQHWDSAGAPVRIAPDPIRSEYLKTGKIIFPNVTPGSVLSIYIEFGGTGALSTFEHWFSGPIPVAEGRFTFSNLDIYGYDFKTYGPVTKGETGRKKGPASLLYHTWTVKDAYPRSDVEFQEDIDVTEPRVALVVRRFRFQQVFESWEEISDDYEKYALKTSFFQSTRKLRLLVDSLSRGRSDALAKSQAVFAWVQKNVSYKPSSLGAINPDRVIASGQGNLWEMAVVMREMFSHLDLKTDVLITRPRSHGGFDPAFVSPSQLAVPLVTVRIGKEEFLAFPWSPGAALGEYPIDYFGLQSLSLQDRSPATLPDFASDTSYHRNVFRIRPDDAAAPVELEMELGGYLAYGIRTSLMEERKKDIDEAFQRILTRLGTSNNLGKCEVDALDKPGKPVTARITFTNPDQAVRRKGETLLRLSHIHQQFFATYDTTRSSGFKTSLDVEHQETVRVPKVPGQTLAASIQCRDLSNALFRVACAAEETADEHVFRRTVQVHRKKLSAAEMRVLAPDILELNRIRESSLVWKSEPAKAAAPPRKGRK